MMTTGMSWFLLEHLAVVRHEERLRERRALPPVRGRAREEGRRYVHVDGRSQDTSRESDRSAGNP